MGVKFTIDTDAHTPSGFNLLRYGLDEARRGWLSKEEVPNTLGFKELRGWLDKKQWNDRPRRRELS